MRILERVGVFQAVTKDAVRITVVIGGDICDEMGGVVQTNRSVYKFDFHFVLQKSVAAIFY